MADVEVGAVAPEAPVAAPVEATPPADTTADPQQIEQPVETPKTFTQEELDKIVQKRLAKESKRLERVARAEAEAAYLRQQLEARERPQQQQPQGKPKEEDFAGKPYSEYVEALAEWKADQKFQAREKESAAAREKRESADRVGQMLERISEGAEEIPDFREAVLADDAPITQAMVLYAAQAATKPAPLLHYLATHQEEGLRIAKLPDAKQVIELHALEQKLSAPPKTTNAPPPIIPNGTKTTVDRDPAKMSDKEFAQWRKRQIAQR